MLIIPEAENFHEKHNLGRFFFLSSFYIISLKQTKNLFFYINAPTQVNGTFPTQTI